MKTIIRLGAILLLGAAPFLRADISLQVTVDTTPLAGVSGFMIFDFFGGNPPQNNVATLTSFATTGALGAGSATFGDVSGSLVPGPLVETANQFVSEWQQAITFGGGLTTFDLDLTTAFTGSAPDSFSFSLLDSGFNSFPTSDPTGADRLFAIDLVGADTTPDVFTSSSATATVTPLGSGGAVPEPNLLPFAFLGFGLMLLVHAMVRRARIARS
jgi:hypothetical protein